MGLKLIIFDYSGTLSLEAVRFGTTDRLMAGLTRSGLAAMGIDTAQAYWQEIVTPTWQEASTTPRGFAAVMTERIQDLAPKGVSTAAIRKAAQGFVGAYIQTAGIDPRWAPALTAVQSQKDTVAVVATDHYPEATTGIIDHLGGMGITALAARTMTEPHGPSSFIVANSADIGYHKADLLFWQALGIQSGPTAFEHILVIDDFGANETNQSDYAGPEAVSRRKKVTLAVIRKALSAPVTTLPFVIESTDRVHEGFGRCIDEANRVISDFIADPEPTG
jgi:hypothetical protein